MRSPRRRNCPISRPISSSACAPRRPRVHCITNAVAQTFTANVLLAAGAIPSMTIVARRGRAFVRRADALLVNLGTFDAERRRLRLPPSPWPTEAHALGARSGVHRPSAPRAAFAKRLVAKKPTALRLNQREFDALGGNAKDLAAFTRHAAKSIPSSGLPVSATSCPTARGSPPSPTATR